MGLSRTVSETDGDFSRKSQKFSHPLYFAPPPAEGVPLGIGYRRLGSKNWNDGATGPNKKFDDIFSRLDTMHQRDRQTDGRTDTGPQQRPRLCIESRGKNEKRKCIKRKKIKINMHRNTYQYMHQDYTDSGGI